MVISVLETLQVDLGFGYPVSYTLVMWYSTERTQRTASGGAVPGMGGVQGEAASTQQIRVFTRLSQVPQKILVTTDLREGTLPFFRAVTNKAARQTVRDSRALYWVTPDHVENPCICLSSFFF